MDEFLPVVLFPRVRIRLPSLEKLDHVTIVAFALASTRSKLYLGTPALFAFFNVTARAGFNTGSRLLPAEISHVSID